MSLPHKRPEVHGLTTPVNGQRRIINNGQNSMPMPRGQFTPGPVHQVTQAQSQPVMPQRSQQYTSMDGFFDDNDTTVSQSPRQPAMPFPSLDDDMLSPQTNVMPSSSNTKQEHVTRMPVTATQEPVRPQAARVQEQASPASANSIDDDEYRQFLEWKKAKQEKTVRSRAANNTRPSFAPVVSQSTDRLTPETTGSMPSPVNTPMMAGAMPSVDTAPARVDTTPARGTSKATSTRSSTTNARPVRQRRAVDNTVESNRQVVHDTPVSPGTVPIHKYPGYDGEGYPKGLMDSKGHKHGPIVERTNIKTGKKVKVEGIAWEDFPPSYQRMLDLQPYDDAGELRIFVKSSGKITQQYPFYELGSDEHSKKLAEELKSKRDLIFNNNVDLSYASRPQLDSATWLPSAG